MLLQSGVGDVLRGGGGGGGVFTPLGLLNIFGESIIEPDFLGTEKLENFQILVFIVD